MNKRVDVGVTALAIGNWCMVTVSAAKAISVERDALMRCCHSKVEGVARTLAMFSAVSFFSFFPQPAVSGGAEESSHYLCSTVAPEYGDVNPIEYIKMVAEDCIADANTDTCFASKTGQFRHFNDDININYQHHEDCISRKIRELEAERKSYLQKCSTYSDPFQLATCEFTVEAGTYSSICTLLTKDNGAKSISPEEVCK